MIKTEIGDAKHKFEKKDNYCSFNRLGIVFLEQRFLELQLDLFYHGDETLSSLCIYFLKKTLLGAQLRR